MRIRLLILVVLALALALPTTASASHRRHRATHHARPHYACSKAHPCAYGLSERACLADERDYWIEIDGENYCERMGIWGEEHTPHTVVVTITIAL